MLELSEYSQFLISAPSDALCDLKPADKSAMQPQQNLLSWATRLSSELTWIMDIPYYHIFAFQSPDNIFRIAPLSLFALEIAKKNKYLTLCLFLCLSLILLCLCLYFSSSFTVTRAESFIVEEIASLRFTNKPLSVYLFCLCLCLCLVFVFVFSFVLPLISLCLCFVF